MPHAPYYTVNFAGSDGKPTDSRLVFRNFTTQEEAQRFIDERKQALDELKWQAVIVEHKTQNEE